MLTLLVGTHIPRLEIGTIEDGPDKLLHFFAFMVITILVRISPLGRSGVRTAVLMVLLAAFDEVTQELPGLNRNFDPLDLIADASGIVTALCWCFALGPTRRGSRSHRLRQFRRLAGLRLMLASMTNWIHVATCGVLGAMIGGVLLGVAGRNPVIGPITMVVVGGMTGFVASAIIMIEAGRRHSMNRIDAEYRCLACLRGPTSVQACSRCGGRHLPEPSSARVPDRRVVLRTSSLVLLLAGLGIGAYVLLLGLVPGAPMPLPVLRGSMSWYEGLQVSMSMTLDATFLGIFAAMVVWWNRRRTAITSELEGVRCLSCGHDLYGASAGLEGGRCPECGADFKMDRPDLMAGSGEQGENVSR